MDRGLCKIEKILFILKESGFTCSIPFRPKKFSQHPKIYQTTTAKFIWQMLHCVPFFKYLQLNILSGIGEERSSDICQFQIVVLEDILDFGIS